jgi:hypothetical protein
MKEFTKQIIVALNDDEWELRPRAVRHIKSRLVIELDNMQPASLPYVFSWWERKVVAYHIRQMQQRVFTERFIAYRLNPKKPAPYSHDDHFI